MPIMLLREPPLVKNDQGALGCGSGNGRYALRKNLCNGADAEQQRRQQCKKMAGQTAFHGLHPEAVDKKCRL